jgi:NADH-quinone oxidoreductase subunit F
VELPLGVTARELIDRHGGGVWKGRKAKAVIPGGLSMGIMTEKELDIPLDFAGPGKVGCLGLGTAAVTVMDETVPIIDYLHNASRFFAHESCGQCTPCREGTSWASRTIARIKAGQGRLKDLEILQSISQSIGIMPGTTICGLADGAAWPLKNALSKFRGELEDYIRTTNPRGYAQEEPAQALVELAH